MRLSESTHLSGPGGLTGIVSMVIAVLVLGHAFAESPEVPFERENVRVRPAPAQGGVRQNRTPQEDEGEEVTASDIKDAVEKLKGATDLREFDEMLEVMIPRGNRSKAAVFLDRAWTALEGEVQGKPKTRAAAKLAIGQYYLNLTFLDKAEPMILSAVESHEQLYGQEHPKTLTSLLIMGILLKAQGRLREAEAVYRRVLAAQRRVLGKAHMLTLYTMSRLGNLLHARDKTEEAEALLREALEAQRHTLREDHSTTLKTMGFLGDLYRQTGRISEAGPYYRKEMEGLRRTLGDDHPWTLGATYDLASVMGHQGEYQEAVRLTQMVIKGWEVLYGKDDPHVIDSKLQHGWLLLKQGKPKESEVILRRVLNDGERVLESDHPDKARARLLLARSLHKQGEVLEAEPLYRKATEAYTSSFGKDSAVTLNANIRLADLLGEHGSLREAEQIGTQVLAAVDTAVPKSDWLWGYVHRVHGTNLRRMGNHPEAEGHLLKAFQALRAGEGPGHTLTREAITELVALYAAWDRPEKANEYRRLLASGEEPPKKWR